ncbi:MAG: carboxymuconolactone decarboxylase family protein [bacterium]
MAWIETISEDDARGSLKQQYDAAVKRTGRVFNIVKISSLRPEILRTFMQLYLKLMQTPSGLSRPQKEMIAVVVSVLNKCHY